MIKNILILGFIAMAAMACKVEGVGSASLADRVVLDVRCTDDAECPSGFECEDEIEHGVATSYCASHETVSGGATGACPAGYEIEVDHGGTFCKPHGGDDSSGGDSGSDAGATGGACQSNTDCAAGLECEVEVEHGVTTSVCKAHGGNH